MQVITEGKKRVSKGMTLFTSYFTRHGFHFCHLICWDYPALCPQRRPHLLFLTIINNNKGKRSKEKTLFQVNLTSLSIMFFSSLMVSLLVSPYHLSLFISYTCIQWILRQQPHCYLCLDPLNHWNCNKTQIHSVGDAGGTKRYLFLLNFGSQLHFYRYYLDY